MALAGFCALSTGVETHADGGNDTTKGAAWLLGDDLSLAALLYNQGAPTDAVDHFLSKAQMLAKVFGVEIKPFPAKSANSAEASSDIVHYLIQGDGALIGATLAQKYDDEHRILFDVSVKSNLLFLLYGPGDDIGKSIADFIKSKLSEIKLPEKLWINVVTSVENGSPVDAVKDAVFKMHKDVANFFIPGSG